MPDKNGVKFIPLIDEIKTGPFVIFYHIQLRYNDLEEIDLDFVNTNEKWSFFRNVDDVSDKLIDWI